MEAKLIWTNSGGKDEDGFSIEEECEVLVFAEERSIVRSEFYEALRSGVSVKKILRLRREDFEQSRHTDQNGHTQYATKIEYEGETYGIIKHYAKGKADIELTCGDA